MGREPMLTGILEVGELPVQGTFWRFLASQHLGWRGNCGGEAADPAAGLEAAYVGLKDVTLDASYQCPIPALTNNDRRTRCWVSALAEESLLGVKVPSTGLLFPPRDFYFSPALNRTKGMREEL